MCRKNASFWERFFIYCGELKAGADKRTLGADKRTLAADKQAAGADKHRFAADKRGEGA